MSFETAAELDLVVSDRALRNVRNQIESELGAVEMGVTDGGTMSAQSARGGSGGSRRRRESLRMERSRTEHLEEAVAYLEDIEDAVSEGGLGGGGGMLAELVGIGGDLGAEAAGTAAETATGLATDVAGTALGQAAGSVIARQISGSTVGVEDTTLSVERPDWVDDVGGGRDVFSPTIEPTVAPTFQPDLGLDFGLPDLSDLTLGIPDTLAVNREPLPVQRDPLPVENVGPLPVEAVDPITVTVETRSRRTSTSADTGPQTGRGPFQRAGGVFDDIGADITEHLLSGDPPPSISEPLDEGGTISGRPLEALGKTADTVNPFTPGGFGSDGTTSTPASAPTQEVTVTHSPTYNVDVDPRRLDSLADRIVSEIEDGVERDIDALEDDLSELESDLQELEREIRR